MNFEKVLPEKKVKKKIMKDAEGERATAVALVEKWFNENKDFHEMPLVDQESIIKYFDLKERAERYIFIKNLDMADRGELSIADFLNDPKIQGTIRLVVVYEKNIYQPRSQDLGEQATLSREFIKKFRHHLVEVEAPEDDEEIRNCFAELFFSQSITKACMELNMPSIESHLTSANRDNFGGLDLEIILGKENYYLDLTMSKSLKTFSDKENKLYRYQLNELRGKRQPDIMVVFAPLLFQPQTEAWEKAVHFFIQKEAGLLEAGEESPLTAKEVFSQLVDYSFEYLDNAGKSLNTAVALGRVEVLKNKLDHIRQKIRFDNINK